MGGLTAFWRSILALVIVISVMTPSFARAMPMQSGPMQTNVMMSMGCNRLHCADHPSGSPTKIKASGCAAAVCISPGWVLPAQFVVSAVSFYPIRHELASQAAPTGILRIPDPYPPRQLP